MTGRDYMRLDKNLRFLRVKIQHINRKEKEGKKYLHHIRKS